MGRYARFTTNAQRHTVVLDVPLHLPLQLLDRLVSPPSVFAVALCDSFEPSDFCGGLGIEKLNHVYLPRPCKCSTQTLAAHMQVIHNGIPGQTVSLHVIFLVV